LLKVIKGEMTRQELMARLELKDRKHFAEQYLRPALALDLIEHKHPEKPNSRLQKYRLTAKAETLLVNSADS
jgi:hypothetical protein